MAGKLDEISRSIGALEQSVGDIKTKVGEIKAEIHDEAEARERQHASNQAQMNEINQKLAAHAGVLAMLQVTRSRIAAWASIGVIILVAIGWVLEAAIKWAVGFALSKISG
jgi:chromosome segregation ATPase